MDTKTPLQIVQQGAVRILTLDRPDAMNALNFDLARALLEAVRAAEADPTTRVVVVAAAGEKAFCAGADLKERRAMNADEKWAQASALWAVNAAIWSSPKAFVAAVQGWCLGGGFELALACDARIAQDNARFGFPEMSLGAFPGAGGAVLLPRLVGRSAARRFFYHAHRADAREALALGIVDDVVPADMLLPTAISYADKIAANTSPLGFSHVKQLLNIGAGLPFDAAVDLNQTLRRPLEATEDYAEGLRAHFEKRKPNFVGK